MLSNSRILKKTIKCLVATFDFRLFEKQDGRQKVPKFFCHFWVAHTLRSPKVLLLFRHFSAHIPVGFKKPLWNVIICWITKGSPLFAKWIEIFHNMFFAGLPHISTSKKNLGPNWAQKDLGRNFFIPFSESASKMVTLL